MNSDCSRCRKPCGYTSQWFTKPSIDAHYCRVQIVWVLANSELIKEGIWPLRESGYIDTHENVQKPIVPISSQEATLMTWSEISARLDNCGTDGETLFSECQVTDNISLLSKAARDALNFMAGRKRKLMPYLKWLWQREQRMKIANLQLKN